MELKVRCEMEGTWKEMRFLMRCLTFWRGKVLFLQSQTCNGVHLVLDYEYSKVFWFSQTYWISSFLCKSKSIYLQEFSYNISEIKICTCKWLIWWNEKKIKRTFLSILYSHIVHENIIKKLKIFLIHIFNLISANFIW